jgi:Domain of unknown function (DUF4338)/Transposase DNA-binding/Transposase Tn5 dimerisation domain
MWVCGREFTEETLGRVRELVAREPELSRAALSRRVAGWMGWKDCRGRPKEMNCRVALLKLARAGVITLPPPRHPGIKRKAASAAPAGVISAVVKGTVAELGKLTVAVVAGGRSRAAQHWKALVTAYHPLGYQPLCGRQVRYLVSSERFGVVAALSFSGAAWQLDARERWIGWSDTARRANLQKVACNSRFLILPTVQVAHLASKVLALCTRRLARDWEQRYGERPLLVETFVDRQRYTGASYRAANWQRVGSTRGRGRNDRQRTAAGSPKDIYLLPLDKNFRRLLSREPSPGEVAPARRALPLPAPAQDWAEQEFSAAALGDRRLKRRLVQMARDFAARPAANLPQACGSRAKTKAAYRFLDHKEVRMEEILKPHYQASAQRAAEHAVVLAVQDTTFLDYSAHPLTQGLGPIGTEKQKGLLGLVLHDTMVYNLERTPLGLLDVQCWARDGQQQGKAQRRRELPIEQKESSKWLHSFTAAERLQRQCPGTVVVSVGDREADIYELFAQANHNEAGAKLLVRACQPRVLAREQGPLWEHVTGQPRAGHSEVHVPRRANRPARVALLEVRFAPVELRPPCSKPRLGVVRLWAVEARETRPPAGVEALHWTLLTTLEVTSFQDAVRMLSWYAIRWQIEVYHRTLKSGCRIEERQLGSVQRLDNCLAIDMVVAWRITQLARLGREMPDVPCSVFFEEAEWKALVSFVNHSFTPPTNPPSMNQAMRMVAGLGGFLGRKSDGHPGTKTLWLGLQRLDDITMAWCAFSPFSKNVPVPRNGTYG